MKKLLAGCGSILALIILIEMARKRNTIQQQSDSERKQRVNEDSEEAVVPKCSEQTLSHKLEVRPAKLFGSSYDLPFRGLPRELRDEIYRYALCVPKLKQILSASEYSVTPPHYEDIDCQILNRHGQVYFPYQCPSRMRSCVPSGLGFLSVNRQMSSEAASVLYGENVFHFSSCCVNQLNGFAKALRPASHTALRHIEINATCLFATSLGFEEAFIKTIQTHFRLDTLTLPVLVDGRDREYFELFPILAIRRWVSSCTLLRDLDAYLNSGRVEALRWTWLKVGYDNRGLAATHLPEHQLRLISLLNYGQARGFLNKSLEYLQQLQEALDRREKGDEQHGKLKVKVSAEWENASVLQMWPKKIGDSDQKTLDAMRKIQDVKIGYDCLPHEAWDKHQAYLAANGGSDLLR